MREAPSISGQRTEVPMRFVTVAGTRPQLIKAAALIPVLAAEHEHVFVDTGQHWDEDMAGRFFVELALPKPDHSLGAGGGSHAEQTAAILRGLEPILIGERPDAVVIFGDTNSTLATALAAAKLNLSIAHVEAGLRSFDRSMPEEINRIVADQLSTWLFAPTPTAVSNLATEGIRIGVTLVGDLMQDMAARTVPAVALPASLGDVVGLRGDELRPGEYIFATVHRAENRQSGSLTQWTSLLRAVASCERQVVLALHPGTREALERARIDLGPHVVVVPPQGYRTTLALQLHAAAVITDSGGIQREAAWLEVPCLVLRGTTEWVEAVESSNGRMEVVGRDIARALRHLAALAPLGRAVEDAAERAGSVNVRPAGAADAILRALTEPARPERPRHAG